MATMTYKVPRPIRRPFETGEIVEVCDRDLLVMSCEKVARAGKRVVRLEHGRTFRASDGWYIGNHGTWPFPSIRHKRGKRASP